MNNFEESGWEIGDIALKDLSLWDENARFPEEYFNKAEKDLIQYVLSKKELKLEQLIKEIVSEFDLPQLERIVVLKHEGKSIVLEGNRRVVAYKLLNNPNLLENEKLAKDISKLGKGVKIGDDYKLEACITEDKGQGLRYVDRKHNKGNNEIGWGEAERRNFASRRINPKAKDVLRVELANAVKTLSLPDDIKEQVLGKGLVTNFYRIVDSASARKYLRYSVTNDGKLNIEDRDVFESMLKVIVFNVWSKKDLSGNPIDSRSLNKAEQIEDYLNAVRPELTSKVDTAIAVMPKEETKTMFGDKMIPFRKNERLVTGKRSHLISSMLPISDKRISNIYGELRSKLDVGSTPNAVAVLFRVFIECSVDCYIERYKIPVKTDIELAGKVLKVVDHLENSLIDEYFVSQGITIPTKDDLNLAHQKYKFKAARKLATKDNNSVLSVSTFHDFVHDYKISPIPSELITHWDNLDEFFIALWEALR